MRCVECPTVSPFAPPTPLDTGVAGASARREYERLAAKREAAIDAKWSPRVARVVKALTFEPQSTRAWAVGAQGEQRLASVFAGMSDVVVLHDRRVPGTSGNIDHVVLAPAGVFVVDAKLYQGEIRIRNRGSFIRPDHRLYVGTRDRSELARKMRRQVEIVTTVLSRAGVDPMPSITPVLCFVDGSWPIARPVHEFEGVRLENQRSIKQILLRSKAVDPGRIDELARHLV